MLRVHLGKNPLFVIFFTVFIDLIGFSILIPIIPLLLADPHSSFFLLPHGMSISQGYILLGFLTGIFAIGQFFSTPILGQLSDKFGRKPLLAVSLIGTLVSRLLFGFGILTHNLPLLFFSRAVDGITGGNFSVAQAAIADVSTPENRAKNFGLMGAAFGLGFILGPYIGGKLSDPHVVSWFNGATPFWFASILCFLNILSVFLIFPETNKHMQAALKINWKKSLLNITHAYTYADLRTLFLTNFFFQAGFTFFITFFGVFLITRFHFTQGNIGDFFSYVGLCSAFAQAFIIQKINAKRTEAQILKVSLIATACITFFYFLPHVWWQLLLIVPFFATANGLSQANITGLISRSAEPHIQGEILGINASIQALAQSLPPVLSGFIAASLSPNTPIIVAGVVMLLGAFLFIFFYKPVFATKQEEL